MKIPASYRMRPFALALSSGPAAGKVNHIWFEGDSISSPVSPRYEQGVVLTWSIIPSIVGWVTAGSEPFSPSGNGDTAFHTVVNKEYDWYGGVNGSYPYGGVTVGPGTQNRYLWSGDEGPAVLLRVTYNTINGLTPVWANGTDWTDNTNLAWKWNFWGTAASLAKVRLRGRRSNDDSNDTHNNSLIAASAIVSYPVAVKAYANSTGVLAPDIITEDDPYVETNGMEMVSLPSLVYKHTGTYPTVGPRVSGTYFSCVCSHGGFDAGDHVNQTKCSDAARTAFYRDVQGAVSGDSVFFVIQLGTNNIRGLSGAQYAAEMLAMVVNRRKRCEDLGLTAKFLLVPAYDTTGGTQFQQDLAAALYQVAVANTDISFFNMYSQAGAFAVLDASYLADHVHPNAAGAVYFMGLIQTAMANSLLSDPVPIASRGRLGRTGRVSRV